MKSKIQIVCIGSCGTLHLFIKKSNDKSSDQKCVVVSYDKLLAPSATIEAKYNALDRPMTFNAFEIYNEDQCELMTAALLQCLSDEQVSEIVDSVQ